MLSSKHFCRKINTLVFSGGGNYGIIYLGIIKYLENKNILKGIENYYGVSAGAICALSLSLDYSYEEVYNVFTRQLNYKKILNIDFKNIFKLTKQFGLNDGSELEIMIKNILEIKNINPYITFKELYDLTKKELNIGATALLKNEFVLLNHKTYPNMPVWLGVRISCSIPYVFTPIIYEEDNEIFVDGSLLNNNPINFVIHNILNSEEYDIEEKEEFSNEEVDTEYETTDKEVHPYKFNFICITLETVFNNININNLSLGNYSYLIFSKLFTNQSHKKLKYQPYVINMDTQKYKDLKQFNLDINEEKINNIIDISFNDFDLEFNKKIKNICENEDDVD